MAEITLRQAAQWCGGRIDPKYKDVTFLGANMDTRKITEGQLFIALVGERDGHDYIPSALKNGAAAVLCSRCDGDFPAIIVDDPLKALGDIARGERRVWDLRNKLYANRENYPASAMRMMFTSNHDENSWSGSEFSRFGDSLQVMTALTFLWEGAMPLIYTGQEIGLNRRLQFFEKDSVKELVDLEYGKEYRDFYKSLTKFRHENKALAAGENVAPMLFVEGASENVLAFTREREGNKVFCLFNFSAEPASFIVAEAEAGDYNCACGQTKSFKAGDVIELPAWGFMLLAK